MFPLERGVPLEAKSANILIILKYTKKISIKKISKDERIYKKLTIIIAKTYIYSAKIIKYFKHFTQCLIKTIKNYRSDFIKYYE